MAPRKSAKKKSKKAEQLPLPQKTDMKAPPIDPKTLMGTKGASISLLSPDMRVLWANRYLEGIHGPLPKMYGKVCHEVYHGRSEICSDCVPYKALKSKAIETGIINRKSKNGKRRYLQSVSVPFLDSKGGVHRILEILFDVTKNKMLEDELKQSEEFYRTLFDHSGTAIAINNKEGIITSVNRTFCEVAGLSKKEIEGKKHYLEFVQDKDRVKKIHEKRWKSKGTSPTRYEFTFLTADKEQRLMDISINRIPGTDYSIASMIDNTEIKDLEKEVQQTEEFLANILKESADGIIVIDDERIIKTWNTGAESIFGYKPDEIIGENFSVLVPADLDKKGELDQLRKEVLKAGYVRNYITERIRKDKRRVTVAETATLIKDENGDPLGRAIILRDITERLRIDTEAVQNEKMKAIGTLSASLAHEIKNPLNSIVINMEILKGQINKIEQPGTQPFHKYINIIQSEIGRLDKVIKDFLDYAKPQSTQYKKLNLGKVVINLLDFIEPEAKKTDVKITKKINKKLFDIRGEENQLKQVILNLLLNALQAMPDGGELTVEVSNISDGRIKIQIKDTGVGIKKEDHNQIFDPFFTTKKKGSGLGLALVEQLVKNHGGEISFESEEEKGTTFSLVFPAA